LSTSRSRTDPHWEGLSPRAKAILAWIAVPISLGHSHREVAERLNLYRPEIEELPLPASVNEDWIGSQMRQLRKEIEEVSA
jgi:hypothetical protein